MPDITPDEFEDIDDYAAAVQAAAIADAARPDFEFAIGGTDPDGWDRAAEYAIEPDRGEVCPDPDCDCGGWVPTPDAARVPNGRPAHDWYAVYATTYAVGATRDGRAHSAILSPNHVRAVRHISTPGVGRTWKRVSLDQVMGNA